MNHEKIDTLRIEPLRLVLEMALSYGKKLKSSQTGYLHYHYNTIDEPIHQSIPTTENLLYALALLKSRMIENVNEAKTILQNILHFQSETGNFPIYLHDYPHCKDRFLAVQVGIVFYWVLKQFPTILGSELKNSLESSFNKIIKHCLLMHNEKAAPYPIALKIAAISKMGGAILNDESMIIQGETLLRSLQTQQHYLSWYSPDTLGEMLSALSIIYPSLKESPWSQFWTHLESTWHHNTCSYIGPSIKEFQEGYEPQVTLYDFFMGYYSGKFSARALKESPYHLKAILIPPSEDRISIPEYPIIIQGAIEGSKWTTRQEKFFAYSLIERTEGLKIIQEKAFHPMRVIWGDHQFTHSIVCQGGNSQTINYSETGNQITLNLSLNSVPELEEREKAREALFYLDASTDSEFFVEGHKSSTFRLDEAITVLCKECSFRFTFQLTEGEGRFIGHRMLGNRLSQICKNGYDAYDWILFLRTLARSEQCKLSITLDIIKNEITD